MSRTILLVTSVLVAAVLLGALTLRFGLGEAFATGAEEKQVSIPGVTMIPTLLPGEVIMVGSIEEAAAKRLVEKGSIVVFSNPVEGWQQVGRVIATGGETVVLTDGVVQIDELPLSQEEIGSYEFVLDKKISALLLKETLGAKSYEIIDVDPMYGPLDSVGPYLVPDGHYFILGDNRDMSMDSRVRGKVGFVPAENIIGRAIYIKHSKVDAKRIGKRLDD